ncbi:hypothetical protein H257_15111 [Aphanomyces astaci]|uniref:H(+)-exporting diphosphatase n=1 Tax=Aphanomyces astaci TaxID=112090 RepID=W4FQD6_APHAT|nr:hypothetical protein H257_15111 [Aphanomyces astaci]ETV69156.1 hypothetical protein H257_15111 [Aphanomyces astaci]|eukprot:XP_009841409.1 hypothetical protein H257_15111 [Aphanomyces astaci]
MPSTTAISDDDYDEIASYIRQERPRSLTKEERLDILRLHAELRRDGQMQVSSTIGRLLGRSQKVVKEVWFQYLRSKNVLAVPPPSNQVQRTTRIPHTHAVTSILRQFIRTRNVTRVRTVAKDVMALLLEAKIIHYDVNCKPGAVNCLCRVQQFLVKLGFKRGKRRGHAAYAMSSAHATARDVYVQHMMQLAPATPVVYLDESYIHHHYARHHDSLYDPTDNGPPKKCIRVADVFQGCAKAKNEPKDYHAMFNHTYFIKWFEKVMSEVEALGKQGVTFVMDNAKYHKGLPADTPRGTWRKAYLLSACQRYAVDVDSHDLKKTIWARLKPVLSTRIDPVVRPGRLSMARARGHDVVFTPTHHSDLQPIEMVWAKVKGDVGVQYTVDTTFADVRSRLDAAFVSLPSDVVWNCVRHCNKLLQETQPLLEESTARRSYGEALLICFRGRAFSAVLDITSFVAGVIILYVFIHATFTPIVSATEIPMLMVGYGFGASFVALFMQLGGGIYTKAADVGADFVGKVVQGIPEDDPRNQALIADLVGDCVGSNADVFEAFSTILLDQLLG